MAIISVRYKEQNIYDFCLSQLSGGKILLIFNHGLGDFINFMPLYLELKNKLTPKWRFQLGGDIHRGFQYLIGEEYVPINNYGVRELQRLYTKIVRTVYPEPTIEQKERGHTKPYCCNDHEIGLPNFIWTPWRNKKINPIISSSNKIGVHFFGNTNAKFKNTNSETAEIIWNEIKEMGYAPFEVHQFHNFTFDTNLWNPLFIAKNETLRYLKADLRKMVSAIQDCKYFVGVDSGPLYLASSILGSDNCVGLEREYKISWYNPSITNIINTSNYKKGSITQLIGKLDNGEKLCQMQT